MNLTNKSTLYELSKKYGFNNSKGLGQNFLINPTVCPKIANSKEKGGFVLEIGPGLGTLTQELAKTSRFVVAVEKDKRLPLILKETLNEFDNIKVINDDFLKLDLNEIYKYKLHDEKSYVCANLPYYITTPIIMHLLESKLPIDSIIVMVQKEAGLRLCAPLATEQAGAISYSINYFSSPKILFNVSRGSFFPSPKVDSCVIKLDVYKTPKVSVSNEERFLSFIRFCFLKRRKIVVGAIEAFFKQKKSTVISLFDKLSLNKNARPANLTLENYKDIFEFFYNLKKDF